MSIFRHNPYLNRRFIVEIDGAGEIGFSEVILPTLSIDVVEYREGSDRENATRRLPGEPHFGNTILRRGFNGSLELYNCWRDVSNGDQNVRRNVIVKILSEDAANPVVTWKLRNAFPIKYSSSDLNAKGCEVAIETIELVCDRVDIE
jgi:phage tail-like protein